MIVSCRSRALISIRHDLNDAFFVLFFLLGFREGAVVFFFA